MSDERAPPQCFFHSYECDGFRAKVTIEWSFPGKLDPWWRSQGAEDIADNILGFAAPKVRDLVHVMRGHRTPPTAVRVEGPAIIDLGKLETLERKLRALAPGHALMLDPDEMELARTIIQRSAFSWPR